MKRWHWLLILMLVTSPVAAVVSYKNAVQFGSGVTSWLSATGSSSGHGIYWSSSSGEAVLHMDNGNDLKFSQDAFNVLSYGAKCDGSTDDSTALQAAITAAATNGGRNNRGGVVLLPKGQCNFGTPLNMKGLYGIRIQGQGGYAPGSPKPSSILLYTGTGATSAIQANAAIGAQFLDVAVLYNSSSFTGVLIDFAQSTQPSGGAYALIQRCLIGTNTNDNLNAFGASSLISFDNMIDSWVRDSNLQGAFVGIHLRDSAAHFGNAITIDGNRFSDFQTAAITNGSQRLTVTSNTFENNPLMISWNSGHPGTYPTMAPVYAVEAAMATQGFLFAGNYVGDGDFSTPFFSTVNNDMHGLMFTGNFFAGNISLGNVAGSSIQSNSFTVSCQITFAVGGTYDGFFLSYNGTVGALTFVNYPTAGVIRLGNRNTTGTNNVADSYGANFLLSTGKGVDTATAGDTLPFCGTNCNAVAYGRSSTAITMQILGTAPGFTMGGNVATVGTQLVNGGTLRSRGSHWNGSSGALDDFSVQQVVDSTAPTSHAEVSFAGTPEMRIISTGATANRIGSALTSGTTIAPTAAIHHVTGTATIQTLTPPNQFNTSNFGGCTTLIFDGVAPWNTAGNIQTAGTPTTAGTMVIFCYDNATSKWYPSRTS